MVSSELCQSGREDQDDSSLSTPVRRGETAGAFGTPAAVPNASRRKSGATSEASGKLIVSTGLARQGSRGMMWYGEVAKPLERAKIMEKPTPMNSLNAGMRAFVAEVLREWGRAKNIKIKQMRYNSDLYIGIWRLGHYPRVTITLKKDVGTFVYHGPEHTDNQGGLKSDVIEMQVVDLEKFLKYIERSTSTQTTGGPQGT